LSIRHKNVHSNNAEFETKCFWNARGIITTRLKNRRVISLIKQLDAKERIVEVAKLISGEEITEASLKGAKQLMSNKS